MQLDVLKQLSKTVEPAKLLEMYNVATGEKVTQEEIDLALKPKKKHNILVVEKELLSSYMEAVSDIKKLKQVFAGFEVCQEDKDFVDNTFKPIIDKHVDRIKSSGIWET